MDINPEEKAVESVVAEAQAPESQAASQSIKINKKVLIIVASAILVLVLAYLAKGFFVAALVNGQPISRWSVISTLEKESGKDLLESLIVEKLIAAEAKAQKLEVADAELEAEIKKIEEQITAQGGELNEALAQQGMTLEILQKQILLQKQVEKLLADKVAVTDEEVSQYITDSQTVIPDGQESSVREQIKSQLANQKLNMEAPSYIEELKAKAKIKYFVNY